MILIIKYDCYLKITDTQRAGAASYCQNMALVVILILIPVIFFLALYVGLLSTLPPLIPSGEVLIGNNDVVLAVTLNSDAVSKVNFNIDASGDSFNVTLSRTMFNNFNRQFPE